MIGFIMQAFGMPLHAEEKRQGWIFDPFDHAIGGHADDARPRPTFRTACLWLLLASISVLPMTRAAPIRAAGRFHVVA